jgi:hypothetical protein
MNVLLEMMWLLLLTSVPPMTELEPEGATMEEYGPTTSEIPPPYALAPKELPFNANAVHAVTVLFEIV